MELYFDDSSLRRNLRGEIQPAEQLLTGIAIETGIELERRRYKHVGDKPSVTRLHEMWTTRDRWSNEPESPADSIELGNNEARWAMQGLSYLGRNLGTRAVDAAFNRCKGAVTSHSFEDTSSLGVPSASLRRASATAHRRAVSSLVRNQDRLSDNPLF